jgi:fructosamine-3-kinase
LNTSIKAKLGIRANAWCDDWAEFWRERRLKRATRACAQLNHLNLFGGGCLGQVKATSSLLLGA